MMFTRGSPVQSQNGIVHLRIPQQRPGMKEGVDYSTQVACHNGNYHIYYTNHLSEVTCEKCKEVGRINGWNKLVDNEIRSKQTFSMQTPDGILNIELGFKMMKEMKYAAWLSHKDDTIVYGATPHEAYSDLMGSK